MIKLFPSPPKWLASLIILIVATLLVGGCSRANQLPVISNLTASEGRVSPSGSCQVKCVASDPDGDELSYLWSTARGNISGQGSVVTWTAPAAPGDYVIAVKVTDGRGGEATTQLTINVAVNHPPIIDGLTAEPSPVKQGETSTIACVASDPDGDELSYLWSTARGNISGQGSSVVWTTPNSCGTYVIAVTVTDNMGGEVKQELEVTVIKPG